MFLLVNTVSVLLISSYLCEAHWFDEVLWSWLRSDTLSKPETTVQDWVRVNYWMLLARYGDIFQLWRQSRFLTRCSHIFSSVLWTRCFWRDVFVETKPDILEYNQTFPVSCVWRQNQVFFAGHRNIFWTCLRYFHKQFFVSKPNQGISTELKTGPPET